MLNNQQPYEQHIVLALEHHKQLLEAAERQRMLDWGRDGNSGKPLLRWRNYLGDLLICMGQRIKHGVADSASKPVWG